MDDDKKKPNRKRTLPIAVCVAGVLFFGAATAAAVISNAGIVSCILLGCFTAGCVFALLAAINRETVLMEDTFVYRTWLGKKYVYKYTDVVWYHAAVHEVWAYTPKKRLVVDTDAENGLAFAEKLAAFGVPDHDPDSGNGITDENGENAGRVLYLEQRKTLFWVLVLGMGVVLTFSAYAQNDPITESPAFLSVPVLFVLCAAYFLYKALFALNVRVELYRDHFIYRTALGRRKRYGYRACVSCRVRRYPREPKRYMAYIRMEDGSKIAVDERIITEGFGAAIDFHRLAKKKK